MQKNDDFCLIIGKVVVPLHLMKSKITHKGVVECIENDLVRVRILQSSACAACKVAGHCSASESKVKIIDVVSADSSSYAPGDNVVVSVSEGSAHMALLVGFGLPFVVMMVALFLAMWITSDEIVSALVGLGALIPYYILVWLLRHRIGNSVTFSVEKLI